MDLRVRRLSALRLGMSAFSLLTSSGRLPKRRDSSSSSDERVRRAGFFDLDVRFGAVEVGSCSSGLSAAGSLGASAGGLVVGSSSLASSLVGAVVVVVVVVACDCGWGASITRYTGDSRGDGFGKSELEFSILKRWRCKKELGRRPPNRTGVRLKRGIVCWFACDSLPRPLFFYLRTSLIELTTNDVTLSLCCHPRSDTRAHAAMLK